MKLHTAVQRRARTSVELEAGPLKVKGKDTLITYVIIFAIIGVAVLYIYAKYLHQPVARVARRIIRRKKK